MSQNKLCTIETSTKITELGGITGPIKNPIMISTDVIIKLINRRVVVYEVSPYDYTQKVLLTRDNVLASNFVKPTPVKKTVVTPTVTPISTFTYNKSNKNNKKTTTVVEETKTNDDLTASDF